MTQADLLSQEITTAPEGCDSVTQVPHIPTTAAQLVAWAPG